MNVKHGTVAQSDSTVKLLQLLIWELVPATSLDHYFFIVCRVRKQTLKIVIYMYYNINTPISTYCGIFLQLPIPIWGDSCWCTNVNQVNKSCIWRVMFRALGSCARIIFHLLLSFSVQDNRGAHLDKDVLKIIIVCIGYSLYLYNDNRLHFPSNS